MKTSNLLTVTFIALGLFIGMAVMSLSAADVAPVFTECGVNINC